MRKYNKWFYITSTIIIIGIILTFTYLYLFQRNFFIKLFGSSLFYRIDRITNFLNQGHVCDKMQNHPTLLHCNDSIKEMPNK